MYECFALRFADVFDDAQEVFRIALRIAHQRYTNARPNQGSIFPQVTFFERISFCLARQERLPASETRFEVFGRRHSIKGLLEKFGFSVAQNGA